MRKHGAVIDYALARRATLTALESGLTSRADVCDADRYLRRAARFHGQVVDAVCPVCCVDGVRNVAFAYGDHLGSLAGRAVSEREQAHLAGRYPEFRVYVVEVCDSCGWNHLIVSYVLGTGRPTAQRKRSGHR